MFVVFMVSGEMGVYVFCIRAREGSSGIFFCFYGLEGNRVYVLCLNGRRGNRGICFFCHGLERSKGIWFLFGLEGNRGMWFLFLWPRGK